MASAVRLSFNLPPAVPVKCQEGNVHHEVPQRAKVDMGVQLIVQVLLKSSFMAALMMLLLPS